MRNTHEGAGKKLSTTQVARILVKIAKEKRSEDKILVKTSEVQSMLKIHENIDVSGKTIRNSGFTHKGYFEKMFDSCEYNVRGNTNYRGMVIKPEEFLQEVEEKTNV